MEKIRVLELCAGYGSQSLALKNLGIDVYSEIAELDKYASQAYMQLHGETKNYGDIYTIDETKLPYFDMITYSTPCQDFSVAGKGKGGDKGSGTRSSILWECERIIRAVKHKYLLMENVKNLLSEKHRHNFNDWFKVLEGMGYKNYYKVINAKDYGIPQNRERIFCVSILGGGQYLFPNPIPLEKRLKDILEPYVDEKYYLSQKAIDGFLKHNINHKIKKTGFIWKPKDLDDCANALRANSALCPTDNTIKEKEVSNTIRCGGGSLDGKHTWDIIKEPLAYDEQNGYIRKDSCVGTLTTDGSSPKHNNRVIEPKIIQNSHGFNKGGVFEKAPTITSSGKYQDNNFVLENYRIRKLTPRECWRLMGVRDEQFDRLHGISNSQLYKLAGNSIVVDVLEAIFKNLLMPETTQTKGQLILI